MGFSFAPRPGPTKGLAQADTTKFTKTTLGVYTHVQHDWFSSCLEKHRLWLFLFLFLFLFLLFFFLFFGFLFFFLSRIVFNKILLCV